MGAALQEYNRKAIDVRKRLMGPVPPPEPPPPPPTIFVQEAPKPVSQKQSMAAIRARGRIMLEIARQEREQKQALERLFGTDAQVITARQILKEVSDHTGVSRLEMMARRRDARVVFARQIAMFRMRQETSLSMPQIGRIFGRDHTTVLNAVRVIGQMIADGKL